jgi:DNA polymerase III subunit epsilon
VEAAVARRVEDLDVRSWSVDELRASRRLVPAAPGVYTFLDENDAPLYVGKSVDLRSRLSSYFATTPARRKTARMMRLASRVRAERSGSEFAALLREAALVQALRPPFNQRMAAPEKYVYLRVDYADPFPRLSLTGCLDDGGRFLGPYVQRRRLAEVIEHLNDAFRLRTCDPLPANEPCWRLQTRRCSGPCDGRVGAGDYGRQFLLVREALSGRTGSALRRLVKARDEHAAAERFEAARSVQTRIEAIERLRRVLFASQAPGCDAVVVQPALAADAVEVWGIAAGSVRGCGTGRPGRADLRAVFERLWVAVRARAADEPLPKEELDRRCIVQRWVRSERNADATVRLGEMSESQAWSAVSALAERQAAGAGRLL